MGSGACPASYSIGTRGSFTGTKAAGAWGWPPTSIEYRMELYCHSSLCLPSRRALRQLHRYFRPLVAYLKSRPPVHASKFKSPRISSATISRALLGHVVLSATIYSYITVKIYSRLAFENNNTKFLITHATRSVHLTMSTPHVSASAACMHNYQTESIRVSPPNSGDLFLDMTTRALASADQSPHLLMECILTSQDAAKFNLVPGISVVSYQHTFSSFSKNFHHRFRPYAS
jgi:hypothetical protein